MRRYEKGFTIYRNGDNPVWVAPHVGSSFETPTSRDWNSDTVASLCWLKQGGSLVLSTLTRKRIWGVDYNRDPPSYETAVRAYPDFVADKNRARLSKYRSKYAFVAKNKADYTERLRIYETFWTTVGNLGSIIILIHRKFARMKNYPSVIDIVTYEGKGVDTSTIKKVLEQINKKYFEKLFNISEQYKRFILMDTERVCSRIKDVFGEFSLEKADAEYKHWLKDDLSSLAELLGQDEINKLMSNFSLERFLGVVKRALSLNIKPSVTLENIFKGRKALSVKSKFFNKHFLIMEAEVNAFLGYWYPKLAADIICDIVKLLRAAKLYAHLGIRQTKMEDFI